MSEVERLAAWLAAMERWWTQAGDGVGWFGSGYNHWGVQTTLKYASAAAAVAARHPDAGVREHALGRARDSYRFAFDSHVSGGGACADGQRWGHTWISALGLERAWLGLDLLGEQAQGLHADAMRVLRSESDWLCTSYRRGPQPGVVAGLWGDEGRNDPESNLWNGALLWRTATRMTQRLGLDGAGGAAEEAAAAGYREQALTFLANGVSLRRDADDDTVWDGAPLSQRHRGANFFDSMALDHHAYLNLGYMVICASQASLLFFDQRAAGLAVPELVHLHQDRLWERLRQCLTPDGRLVRVGGDSRVRYAYCQEYVPAAALYAREHLGDRAADDVVAGYLDLVAAEVGESGAFYDRRLGHLEQERPYYYTRLESDRANALAFLVAHDGERSATPDAGAGDAVVVPEGGAGAEAAGAGAAAVRSWSDEEHGVVMVRGRRRIASHSWRAFTTTQGLCLPVAHGDMAEYHLTLAPSLRIEGDSGAHDYQPGRPGREVIARWQAGVDGGFATVGRVLEGTRLAIAEGWKGGGAATSTIAMVALPDDATVVGLQVVTTGDWTVGMLGWHGLNLGIPNDLHNGGTRTLRSGDGERVLVGAHAQEEVIDLGPEAEVDGVLRVRALTGGPLQLLRSATPNGGPLRSLRTETLAVGAVRRSRYVPPRTTLVDTTYLLHVGDGPAPSAQVLAGQGPLRAVRVGAGAQAWTVLVNVSDEEHRWEGVDVGRDLVGGVAVNGAADGTGAASVVVPPLQARVLEHD